MELLGDLGSADQLSAARSENVVLQKRVQELSQQVQTLSVANATLQAEGELYRSDHATANPNPNPASSRAIAKNSVPDHDDNHNLHNREQDNDHDWDLFVRSGNGIYPALNDVTLAHVHGQANPLCCALSTPPADTVLATGGADSMLRLSAWGAAVTTPAPTAAAALSSSSDQKDHLSSIVSQLPPNATCAIRCNAPVICTAFSPILNNIVAAACMDGTIQIVVYKQQSRSGLIAKTVLQSNTSSTTPTTMTVTPTATTGTRSLAVTSHRKFIRAVAWSNTEPVLATASADGTVQIIKIVKSANTIVSADEDDDDDDDEFLDYSYSWQCIESLHLSSAVESISFIPHENRLICFARDTPYLQLFDLDHQDRNTSSSSSSRLNLNTAGGAIAAGGFDHHVSFAVMDIKPNPTSNYVVAAATDTSRNLILDLRSGKHVRNLYGHSNDGYSQPRVAWSANGQYLLGNTQDEPVVCVWDVASSTLHSRMGGHGSYPHNSPIRDLYNNCNDTLVTTSFDKTVRMWFAPPTI